MRVDLEGATYQKLFNKAKLIIKEDANMKFYDEDQATVPRDRCFWSVDRELPYYKPEAVQAAQDLKHQASAYLRPIVF